MTDMLFTWIISSIFLYLTAVVVPGFKIHSFGSAMIAALVVGFFNMLLRPILLLLTLPINILTLGLFTFIVNAIILRLAAGMLKGFDIKGWVPAVIGAIVLAIIQAVALMFFGTPAPPPAAV